MVPVASDRKPLYRFNLTSVSFVWVVLKEVVGDEVNRLLRTLICAFFESLHQDRDDSGIKLSLNIILALNNGLSSGNRLVYQRKSMNSSIQKVTYRTFQLN